MPKHVVVVGGGFAGLQVVRSLRNTSFAVTLIDKTNHHLFSAAPLPSRNRCTFTCRHRRTSSWHSSRMIEYKRSPR
jgi:UDP-N-acetylmuramoylalanine-D-glutamate ligase